MNYRGKIHFKMGEITGILSIFFTETKYLLHSKLATFSCLNLQQTNKEENNY